MKSKEDLLWHRADLEGLIFLVGGFILLLVEVAMFISDFGVLSPYLGDIAPLYAEVFAIPIVAMLGGAFIFHFTGRKMQREFPMQSADIARMMEAVLKRLGIPYAESTTQYSLFPSLRPRIIIALIGWDVKLEIQGGEEVSKILGPFSRVYVGKITKQNRTKVRSLLREFDNAGRPAILGGQGERQAW